MEAQAQELTPVEVRPTTRQPLLRPRLLLQVGMFVGAFTTVAGLAVVLRPMKVDHSASIANALMVAPPQSEQAVATATLDDMDQGTKDARAALAAALRSFGQGQPAASGPADTPPQTATAPTQTPVTAAVQAPAPTPAPPPAPRAQTRLANLPRTANTAPPLPSEASAFANGQAGAAGKALASIEAVAPHTPLPAADLQRMAGHAARAIRMGDIAGARAILQRASEAGDATALFALAQTYDPDVLARMRVRGMSGDSAKAEALYQQAADAGVSAAKERLARK